MSWYWNKNIVCNNNYKDYLKIILKNNKHVKEACIRLSCLSDYFKQVVLKTQNNKNEAIKNILSLKEHSGKKLINKNQAEIIYTLFKKQKNKKVNISNNIFIKEYTKQLNNEFQNIPLSLDKNFLTNHKKILNNAFKITSNKFSKKKIQNEIIKQLFPSNLLSPNIQNLNIDIIEIMLFVLASIPVSIFNLIPDVTKMINCLISKTLKPSKLISSSIIVMVKIFTFLIIDVGPIVNVFYLLKMSNSASTNKKLLKIINHISN